MPDTALPHALQLDAEVSFHGQLCGSFGIDTSRPGRRGFHLVVHGRCWARFGSRPTGVELGPGDVLLFGSGRAHLVSSGNDIAGVRDPQALLPLGRPAPLPATGLVCGYFDSRSGAGQGWLEALPHWLVIKASRCPSRWSLQLVQLMLHEATARIDDGMRLTSQVAGLFLARCIRDHLLACPADRGLLAARREPRLRRVIDAVAEAPGTDWTVARLASTAGVSRSKFASWFADVAGCTPMDFVRRERVLAAARRLATERVPMHELAASAGYRSVPAFRRQYERIVGEPLPWRSSGRAVSKGSDG